MIPVTILIGLASTPKLDTLPLSFKNPTCMAFQGNDLLVAEEAGKLWRVRDGEKSLVLRGLNPPLSGLLVRGDSVFVSHRGKVSLLLGDSLTDIITGLPSFGQNTNAGLAFGPGGFIYLGQGEEECFYSESGLAGALLRFKPDGSGLEVFSRGFHEPIDIMLSDGMLWVSDPGCYPADYAVTQDGVYRVDSKGEWVAVNLEPGSYPRGLCILGDTVFVACYGDPFLPAKKTDAGLFKLYPKNNRTGKFKVEKVAMDLGRPVDVELGPDGALWVLDGEAGRVFRIRKQ